MRQKNYPVDLSEREWKLLEPMIPPAKPGGRPRQTDMREVMNAVFYVLRGGIQWRMLPEGFPPWQTVYGYFWRWKRCHLWEQFNQALLPAVRVAAERHPEPSAAILDSQSAKTTEQGGIRGVDGGKKVKGRKRQILVDTQGLLLTAHVHPANEHDSNGGKQLLRQVQGRWPRITLLWVDNAYRHMGGWISEQLGWQHEVVGFRWRWMSGDQPAPESPKGFQVFPRRWVAERSLAWFSRNRRLSKDYERLPDTEEAFLYASSVRLMLKRLDRLA